MSELSADEIDDLCLAANGSDRQWWNKHKQCGGCGDATCHPGVGCTPGWNDGGCRYCPNRQGADALAPPVKKQHVELEGQQDLMEMLT